MKTILTGKTGLIGSHIKSFFDHKNHELKLYLPNSNFNDPDIELWSTFSLIHTNEVFEWQTEHTKENIASLEDAIQECIKQSKLIREKF